MISSSTSSSLSNIPPTPSQPTAPTFSDPPSSPESPSRRIKSSPQLNRWSRARAVRSGRKLIRPVERSADVMTAADSPAILVSDTNNSNGSGNELPLFSDGGEGLAAAKSIYMVSDGTGWTVEHSVTAALGQFEHCLVDRVCPINTHLFSGTVMFLFIFLKIDDVDRLMEVVAQAAKEGAMLVYTLADPSIAESARQACLLWGVTSLDVLSPITEAVASHLGVSPSGLSRWAPGRNSSLGEDYFRRIEAIEFTMKQDDGAFPRNLHQADIVLTGVSRTGKTPLSIYLAQKGYKVANVPIVMNVDLPKMLFEVDPEKVFALTINPVALRSIRRARAKTLGLGDSVMKCNYSEMDYVKQELEFASKIFQQNPIWPVIEVTAKAIEETAAIVLRLYHDRKNRCLMPRISKRY
ncbi:hypothetical protein SASPL_113929 [Salvia splendens]|uniref:Pyruvate, phosphate dikinase regulatory protein n=1 Tax=Salvia splendens TaxID=180675 RepID=A0A8X8Y4L4_SALSN|nr:hypothetical protein SASPL_113929 [Salvia splendens]